MSIRNQILVALVLMVTMTVMLTMGIAFVSAREWFEHYVEEDNQAQANDIADELSLEYTLKGGWEKINIAKTHSVFFEEWDIEPFDDELLEELEPLDVISSFGNDEDFIDELPIQYERVILTDQDGLVLYDNYHDYPIGFPVEDLENPRAQILDLRTKKVVGQVYVDSDQAFAMDETYEFLYNTFWVVAAGGCATLVLAIFVALWWSRRITTPITQLTEKSESLATEWRIDVETKESNDELQRMSHTFKGLVEALNTQKQLRQRLLGDLSHEINTPLSVIRLEAKGLGDGFQTPEQASQHIIAEIDKLKHLIQDLNWIAETDSGDAPLFKAEFDLYAALTEEIARWQLTAQAKDLRINFESKAEGAVMFNGDKDRLMQAVGNVISNALNYSNSGSSVEVELNIGEEIEIQVSDSGIGIAPEDLPHVMDRFYRTDLSRTHRSGGRGIGLSIVRSIVEAHGGQVDIQSAGPNRGTQVTILV
mgnify:FL=1